jgi:hypothetical protein
MTNKSDEYRRFAAECLKIAYAAEDQQYRATFLKMAEVLVDLARKEEANPARGGSSEDEIN